MPEARFPSNANQLSSNIGSISVIVVTSLWPKGRPPSVRQQRLAEFRSSEASRTRLKEARRREKLMSRKTIRDEVMDAFTAEDSISVTAPCQSWINQSLVYPAMEQTKEDQQYDDVKVLYPARDLVYSDSEAAILSSCSSWCAGPPRIQDLDPSRMVSEKFSCTNELLPPRPRGRIGLVDGPDGIGDRYLNKPPDGFIPSDDVISFSKEMERKEIQKPFRQVWHSVWEHHVRRDSVGNTISAKRTKHVSQLVSEKEEAVEPTTTSVSNICLQSNLERKQRRGIFHAGRPMIQTKATYQSQAVTRLWGRAFHQRGPSMCTRIAKRKVSLMKDDGLEDSQMFEKKLKPRRCELSERKIIPRAVVKTASRLGSAVIARKKESNSFPTERKSSPPPNAKRGATGSSNNRAWHFKPTKLASKTRISVTSDASQSTEVSNFKESYTQKPVDLERDLNVMRRMRSFRYRGVPGKVQNIRDRPLSDLNQNAGPSRDSRLSVHFNVPERSCSASLPTGGRFYPSPMYNQADLNIFDTDPDMSHGSLVDANAECKPLPKVIVVSDDAPQYATPRRVLRSKPISKLADRGFRGKSTFNVPNANRFYCHPAIVGQSTMKSPHIIHPSCRTPAPDRAMPPRFSCDLAVSPDVLYDRHPVTDQMPTAFRFSHPNAPDVLISPPPNPQFVDTLSGPNSVSDSDSVPICNPRFQAVNIPRYYGHGTPDTSIEENYNPLPALLQPSVPFESFVPSIDFRFPTSRPHPRPYFCNGDDDQKKIGYDKNSPFLVNLQQVGIPTTPYLTLSQSEKTPKPFKTVLTFGAQVPSSTRISINTSKCLSSSPEEMQVNSNLYPHDTLKSNLPANSPLENLANVVHYAEEDGCDFNQVEPMPEPLTPQIRTNECSPYIEKAITITTNEDTVCNSQEDVSPRTSLPMPKVADPFIEVPRSGSLTVDSSRAYSDLEPTQFESVELGSEPRNLISTSHSNSKLSTVPETSVLTQLPSDCLSTAFEFNSPYAPNSPNIYATDIDQKERLSGRIGGTVVESMEKDCLTMESTVFGNTCNEVFPNSQELANSVPSPCNEDYGGVYVSPVTGYVRHVSDMSSDTYRVSYVVRSTGQQTSVKETSFEKNTTTRLDSVLEDSVIATQKYSIEAPAVPRLDSLPKYVRPREDSFSDSTRTLISLKIGSSQAEKVERRDACVQVPVLCTQCVETELFTAEKGVPDCRAGLAFKLMSSIVDVPPEIKRTESVGINTEGKRLQNSRNDTMREGSVVGPTSKQDSDSRLTLADQLYLTSLVNANSLVQIVDDGRRSIAPVPAMDKEINRLKHFFKSHRHELANVYNLAAAHGVTLVTNKEPCSVVMGKEKLRTDSNEIRKDKHSGSSDDEWNCRYENEQPGRISKQLVGDRRVSFRPFRRESDIVRSRDVCQDERPKHQGMPVAEKSSQIDELHPQVAFTYAKKLRKLKRSEKLREEDDAVETEIQSPSRTTDFGNVVDRPNAKNILEREKSISSNKPRELSELSRLSNENLNADVIALKRKPGCALCKKIPLHKKKGILKSSSDAGSKIKPLDIPGSILQFGLSNIVIPANVNSKEAIMFPATSSGGEMSEIRSHEVRNTVSRLRKVALEVLKKTKPVNSDELDIQGDPSSVTIHNSSTIKKGKERVSQNADRSASIHPFHTDESILRTICLTTMPKNRGESDVESFPVSNDDASMLSAFNAFKLVSEKIRDSENFNSTVNRFSKESEFRRADAYSKTVEDVSSSQNCFILAKNTVMSEPYKCMEKTVRKMKAIDLHDDSKEDHNFLREIASDPKNTVRSDVINTLDSPRWTGGCMFTAMRRFMKNRPHSASSTQINGADCNSGYPGFQFTGVPSFENQSPHLDSRKYYNRCKCKHRNFKDLSPAASAEESPPTDKVCRNRTPTKCIASASRTQKCYGKLCDAGELTDDSEQDEDIDDFSSSIDRGHKSSCAKNRQLWQSVYRRRREESKLQSPSTPDPFDSDDLKSGSSEDLCSAVRLNISDNFCSCNVGLSCPESRQFLNQVLTCVLCNKKDCVDKPTHGIRNRTAEKVFEMRRNPRSTSLHRSTVSSRSSARASSAPTGQVRISPVRCWPLAHSVYKVTRGPRRVVKHVKLLECDSYTCERCAHRKRQRIPSGIYYDKLQNRKRDHVFLMVEDRHYEDFNDEYDLQCSCCASRKDYKV